MAFQKKTFIVSLAMIVLVVGSVFSVVCAEEAKKININTATVEELVQLKWIGPEYAQRIIEKFSGRVIFPAPWGVQK